MPDPKTSPHLSQIAGSSGIRRLYHQPFVIDKAKQSDWFAHRFLAQSNPAMGQSRMARQVLEYAGFRVLGWPL
jgi:hypothetical protein